jgi:hypothetical protein
MIEAIKAVDETGKMEGGETDIRFLLDFAAFEGFLQQAFHGIQKILDKRRLRIHDPLKLIGV